MTKKTKNAKLKNRSILAQIWVNLFVNLIKFRSILANVQDRISKISCEIRSKLGELRAKLYENNPKHSFLVALSQTSSVFFVSPAKIHNLAVAFKVQNSICKSVD